MINNKDLFIEKANIIHNNKYDYAFVSYINSMTKVSILCKKHGIFKQTPGNHLSGKGCSLCAKENKSLNTEFFINKAKKIHNNKYDYTFVNYINTKTPIKIICNEHGEFWQKPNSHICGKGCPKCGLIKCKRKPKIIKTKRSKKDLFIEKAIKKHGDKYNYDNIIYINNTSKIEIVCNEHGSFWQTPCHHLSKIKRAGCPQCNYKSIGKREFLKRAEKLHGNKYQYKIDHYIDCEFSLNLKIDIICKIHGEFKQTAASHVGKMATGCPKCYWESLKSNTEEFILKAKEIHGENYDYSKSEYICSCKKINIICNKCNKMFLQTPSMHLVGHGCPKCCKTISNKEMAWLNYIGLPDDDKHRQVVLNINNKQFKVDGFNEETKTIYEFYGDCWHGNPQIYNQDKVFNVTKTTFGYLYNKTLEREKMIKENGYQIISIWENDWNDFIKNGIKK